MSAEQRKSVTLTIDGREITVPAGTLVIRAAEQLGVYIPRFCDHPLLDPVGACRQCLVEVEGQRKPLTACTTQATEGMVVKTQFSSPVAKDAQEGVLELLLINHPLDCPTCDKGGECPLQDQALAYGPGGSRYIDPKRRYAKPIPISPLVKLDRERCVLCARCTRFADQIAGDPFIELFERGALEQVAVFTDEPYESIFSGNVIQICPVGALLSSTFRFRARPFDMTSTPSQCNLCASGCSIEVQERRGEIVRVLARANADVNDEWICDKGRFSYAYTHDDARVTEPLVRKDGSFVAVSWAEALRLVADRFAEALDAGKRVAVLGGQQLLDEDSYALSRFARTVLRTNDIDGRRRASGANEDEVLARVARGRTASYGDLDEASAVVLVGTDVRQESPIVFLRLRKNARKHGTRVYDVAPVRNDLFGPASSWVPCLPGGEAHVLRALAAALRDAGASLDDATSAAIGDAEPDDALRALAQTLVRAEGKVVVLAGERLGSVAGGLPLAWNIAAAVGGRFGWVPRKGGGYGAVWAGCNPTLLPGGRAVDDDAARAQVEDVWGAPVPAGRGRDAQAILEDLTSAGALLLAGSDPVTDFGDRAVAGEALASARFVVALDLFRTASTEHAHVILPAAAVYERDGTLSDWEGRAQPVRAAFAPAGVAQADWEILSQLAATMGVPFPRTLAELRGEMDALRRPSVPPEPVAVPDIPSRPPLERMTLVTWRPLLANGTLQTGARLLNETQPEGCVHLNRADAERIGIADGDTVRVSSARGELRAPVRISRSVGRSVVYVPTIAGVIDPQPLIVPGDAAATVRVEKV